MSAAANVVAQVRVVVHRVAGALAVRIRAGWGVVRTLAGEDDYARYLQHHAAVHPGREPMNARAFYREREQRKWDGVKRCC